MFHVRRAVVFAAVALTLVAALPGGVAAATVDPATLQPPPPPGALCTAASGAMVICRTDISFVADNEPLFDIACGTLHQTSTETASAVRWYETGLLARRVLHAEIEGVWSLGTGSGSRRLPFRGSWSSLSEWQSPGDESTLVETLHGVFFKAKTPGIGSTLMLAGHIASDGGFHGRNTVDDPIGTISPSAIATLEAYFCD